MDREILTTVTFQENCEYESSTNTRKIGVPKQTVEVSVEVNNLNTAHTTPQYNDKLQFIANVYQDYIDDNGQQQRTPITVGRIQFFYLADDTKTPVQLNADDESDTKKSCLLNNQGRTSIIYRPNKNGQIFAKYIDDNDFYETATSSYVSVEMSPIEVKITIDAPPILTDIHDEVELTAHVTKKGTNEPLPYGVVTFLHYQTNDDVTGGTNERVIGNPVMVEEDGTATIRYIPVQTDDNGEPYIIDPPYREHIRVVYNYSNVLYGEQWKYYKEASVRTQIAICSRDSITIGLDSTYINESYGQHQYDELDDIHLYGVITDKNNNTFPIKTSGDYKANLTFHIEGVHVHPKKMPVNLFEFTDYPDIGQVETNNFNYVKYSKDITATYHASENKYYFDTVINNLLPGYYTVTASCKEQEGTDDKMYDAVDDSNVLYIQVNYISASPVIQVSSDKNIVRYNEKVPNIKGEVTNNLSDNQKSILNGQPCKFYIPKINQEYMGTLIFDNESKKLIGTPNSDISFNQVGIYFIYMKIPVGIYTKSINSSTYHGHNIDYCIVNNNVTPLLIQVENKPKIILDIEVGELTSYYIKGIGISRPINIDVYLTAIDNSNPSLIQSVKFSSLFSEAWGPITDLAPGDYRLTLKVQDGDDVSKTFSIPAHNLHFTIDKKSKKILGTPQNTISAFLYAKEKLQSINTSKIKAYIQSAKTDFNIQTAKQATIQSTKIRQDGSVNVIVQTGLYEEGEWWLVLTYEGGEGFNPTICKEEKFETFLYTPIVKLIPYQDRYDIKIYYDNDDNTINNNAMLISCAFIKAAGNRKVADGVIITNEKGHGSFKDDKYANLSWWDDWDILALSFGPYDQNNIQIMKNQPAYNALDNKYNYVFDAFHLTDVTNPTYNIRAQIIGNEEKALYTAYKECTGDSTIKITRPLG